MNIRSPNLYFLAIPKVYHPRTHVSITLKGTTWSKNLPLHHIEITFNNVTGRLVVNLNKLENCVFYSSLNCLQNLR